MWVQLCAHACTHASHCPRGLPPVLMWAPAWPRRSPSLAPVTTHLREVTACLLVCLARATRTSRGPATAPSGCADSPAESQTHGRRCPGYTNPNPAGIACTCESLPHPSRSTRRKSATPDATLGSAEARGGTPSAVPGVSGAGSAETRGQQKASSKHHVPRKKPQHTVPTPVQEAHLPCHCISKH